MTGRFTPVPQNPLTTDQRHSSPGASHRNPMMELALRAKEGDTEAASQLLHAVGPSVRRAAMGVLGPLNPDVEDVVQQSLIQFVQALPGFRGECHPKSYACTIVIRAAIAQRKRGKRHQEKTDVLAEHQRSLGQSVPCPGTETMASRRRSLVRELLEQIPAEQAEALSMRVILGHSLDEIANVSGAPVNTVRSRIRLAREALRRKLEADPGLRSALEGDA